MDGGKWVVDKNGNKIWFSAAEVASGGKWIYDKYGKKVWVGASKKSKNKPPADKRKKKHGDECPHLRDDDCPLKSAETQTMNRYGDGTGRKPQSSRNRLSPCQEKTKRGETCSRGKFHRS